MTRARALNVSPSASTVTTGFAPGLWYQAGFVGAPPLEATTTYSPFSLEKASGFSRGLPLLGPVLGKLRTYVPLKAPGLEAESEAASLGLSTSVSGNLILLGGSSRREPVLPAAVTVLPQGRGAPAVAIRSM